MLISLDTRRRLQSALESNASGNEVADAINLALALAQYRTSIGLILANGSVSFTAPIAGVTPVNPNEFATKAYVDTHSGGGTVQGATNLGTANGIFASLVGTNLTFKSIRAGANITITPSSTELLIASTGGGGGAVDSVNGQTGVVVLDSDNIAEGVVNFYYTQGRFDAAFAAKTTSALTEGSNLYYTQGRFDAAFAAKTTSALTEGTNFYYTQARFDTAFAAKTTTNLVEGVNLYFTTGRFDSAFATKSTTNLVEGSNLYYTQGRFDSAFAAKSTSNLVEGTNLYYTNARVNTEFDIRLATKTTDNLAEGASNLYYTQARFDTAFAAKTTSALAEGSNLYYTQARFDAAFAAKSTTNLSEGLNLYYTQARFDTAFAAKSTTDLAEGLNLYYTAARFNSAFAAKTTDNLTEGVTNLYFTPARAQTAAVENSINSGTTNKAPSEDAVFNALAAKQNTLGYTAENVANKGQPNGYAGLDASGFVPITQLPPSVIERLVIVANQAARFALTTATVQNGDTVKQADTNVMYFVVDDTNLGNSSGYSIYNAGTAASVPYSGVTGVPTASSILDGILSHTDWNTFNNKQNALTFGNLTDVGTDGITVTGGTGAVIGSGTSIAQQVADATHNGYLSSGDWNTFSSKEPAIASGTTLQYWRGDKSFQTLNTLAVPELTNLYYTQSRFDSAFAAKTTDNLTEGVTNLYFTNGRASAAAPVQSVAGRTGVIILTTADIGGNLSGDVGGPLSATLIGVGAVTDTKGSLANKPAVTVVATTNQALSGLPVIDGISTAVNSLILLTAQSTASQNGPWSAQSGAWVRPTWYPSGGTTQAFQFITTLVRLGNTYAGTVWRNTTVAPITIDTTATTWVVTKISLNSNTATQATASTSGFLSAADWTTFNNKLDASRGNYITNSDAEVNTSGWNLYNDSGNTAAAIVVAQDITYTAVASGNAGNGINIDYIFHATQSYLTPLVTVVSPTLVTVAWYNGPSVANNPTATQLKAAWDAVPGAVALATATITGVASNKQYETGSNITANGGDSAPVDGTGGTPSGVTLTRNTSTPLVGTASFDLGKIAANEQGQGVSTDFTINSLDKGNTLQISFAYEGLTGMVLGTSSDVRVFVYDITNATLIPVSSKGAYVPGPVNTPKTFTGQFLSSATSVSYRLIIHISTTNASAWDFLFDSVTVNDVLVATAQTQVPSLVLSGQPISGAVTDHMVVMWTDSATQWIPATIAGAALATFGSDKTQLGFATKIVGSTADIFVAGMMDGFSFGPFVGYEQYIDNTAGAISPLPSPFTDLYVMVGMAISSTVLNIQFTVHLDLISNASGVPIKGGLLTSSAVNDGTGDVVLSPGANGQFLVANSAVAKGLNYRAIVAGDIPTLNQNTTGSAATLTTARTIAGTSFNGSANITLANKFIVQGTADAGLTGAQFLGSLATGILKNTTTTGVLSIAVAADFPTLNQNTTGTAANVTGVVALANGGTGVNVASANALFNALSPMTTLGDMEYEDATPKAVRLAGNITTAKQYLSQTGNGTISAAPVWATIASTDITNSSVVTGTTITDALNTLSQNFTEVFLSAIKNAGAVTANTEIPTWTTVTKDTNSAFNSSTGTFTVPIAGDYVVEFHADTTALTPTAQIYKNGVLVQTGINSLTRTFVTTTLANCAVNDTIWVALDTTATMAATSTDTVLNIYKVVGPGIGPVNARYHASATAITASLTTMTYTTKDFDTQAAAYSAGVYTIPSAGKYSVKASMAITATTVAAGNLQVIIIRKNSTEIARYEFVSGAATQKPAILIVEDLVSCALNDTIDIQISSASTTPSITASNTMNFFYINKMSI